MLVGLSYMATLAPGPTWSHAGADSGEFLAAAAVLGVAHPGGYPTYVLLLWLAQQLSPGNPALGSGLLSVATALGALLCIARLVFLLLCGAALARWQATTASYLAALWLAFAPIFWSQASIVEVYSLNALFVALLLLWLRALLQSADCSLPLRWWHGLLAGLALGNHLTVLLPVGAWLLASVWQAPTRRLSVLLRLLAGVGSGLLVYLYVPLRAATHPPINWGGATTWDGFWWLVSGSLYRSLVLGVSPAFWLERVQAWVALLLQQFGWPGVALGLFGLLYAPAGTRRFLGLSAGLALLYSLFAIGYDTRDSAVYLIPVYLVFAVWLGVGVALLLQAVVRWRSRRVAAGVAVLLLAGICWSAVRTYPTVDASKDERAIQFARRVLTLAPPGALILTSGDEDTFPLWYDHFALRQRPDVAVVVEPLLGFAWYRHNLAATYPALAFPPANLPTQAAWTAAFLELNQATRPICRTRIEVAPPTGYSLTYPVQAGDPPLVCGAE